MLGQGCLIVGVVAQIRHKRAIRKTKLKKLKGFGAEDKTTGTQLVLDKVQVKPGLSTAYIDLMQLLP